MSAFVIICGLAFLVLAVLKLRSAFLLFLFLAPLVPSYVAIVLQVGGAGISLTRLMSYGLFIGIGVRLARRPIRLGFGGTIPKTKLFLATLFAVFFLGRLISSLLSPQIVAVVYWFDDTILSFSIFWLAKTYICDVRGLGQLVGTVGKAIVIVVLIGFLEYALKAPVLSSLITVQVSTVGADVMSGFQREGAYRAIAMFDNPITLAEYLSTATTLLFILCALRRRSPMRVLASYAAVLGSAYLLTAARYLVISLILSLSVATSVHTAVRLSRLNAIANLSVILVFGFGLYFAYQFVADPIFALEIAEALSGDSVEQTASIVERAAQYIVIPVEVASNPWGGFLGEGMKSDIMERLGTRLDNYYLAVLIEGGYMSLAAYLGMLIVLIIAPANRRAYTPRAGIDMVWMRFCFTLFFVSFFVNKLFVSVPHNNYLLFLMVGVFFGVTGQRGTEVMDSRQDENSPRPQQLHRQRWSRGLLP
ncbi:hypothetical protein MASR1M32_31540 [Rhodobacter sp.]